MRRVVLVPLVHDEADLGTAGPALLAETIRLAGAARWAAHTETLARYWAQVAAYLHGLDPRRLKLYQDGLPVGGLVGRTVVEEAARRGSRNYRLLLELMNLGAELRQTEDASLLQQEYDLLARAPSSARPGRSSHGATQDAESRRRLLRERDEFIARTIDATLGEGEIGVLFLGAEHQAAARLAPDIVVQPLKDPVLVRAYFQTLLARDDRHERAQLASYVGAPIDVDFEETGSEGAAETSAVE
jgi:hypothetical protein